MSERNELLSSITATTADYREGDFVAPTPAHAERWVNQFNAAVQLPILREMDHVPQADLLLTEGDAKLFGRAVPDRETGRR